MLRTLKDIESYRVSAADGDIGKVSDFYLDDDRWTIRYLVVDTGGFWDGPHRVLVSPISFRQAEWSTRRFHLALDRAKIRNSPTVDLNKPVSRQYEQAYHHYYGWAPYWGFGGSWDWGLGSTPGALAGSTWEDERAIVKDPNGDPDLRSAKEIVGYHLKNGNESLGYIADLIVDDETWAIRYWVIDTHKWWPGKKVLVAPSWAAEVNWAERTVYADVSKETIKDSPPWNPDMPVNREYEMRLYDYHGQPAYWLDTERAKEKPPIGALPAENYVLT